MKCPLFLNIYCGSTAFSIHSLQYSSYMKYGVTRKK